MAVAAVIGTTCFSKHDGHACGWDFHNDTENEIPGGVKITQGCLVGITASPICVGHCGSAEFITGPTEGYRMYPTEPLAADVCVGDPVMCPDDGSLLGYAVSRALGGGQYAGLGADALAAKAGDKCIAFVAVNQVKPAPAEAPVEGP